MITEEEVQRKLSAVANDELPLFEFADWLDSKSWGMHRDSQPAAIRLVSSIERQFAEYDRSVGEAALLRNVLAFLAKEPNVIRVSITISFDRVSRVEFMEPRASATLHRFPEVLIPLRA